MSTLLRDMALSGARSGSSKAPLSTGGSSRANLMADLWSGCEIGGTVCEGLRLGMLRDGARV
ncbi:MAG: hypothetical protein ACPGVS_09465 [Primorskyibacter sp.]